MTETMPETAPPEAGGAETPPVAELSLEEKLAASEAEADRWKANSRKNEDRAKANSDAAKKLAAIEEANKTEVQKAADALAAAEAKAATLRDRAVRAEVKALAAEGFADSGDAAVFLDASKYVDVDGDVDTDAIKADLAELLEKKPHLAKAKGVVQPKPDPSQGAKPDGQLTDDDRIREAEKAGDWATARRMKFAKQVAAQ